MRLEDAREREVAAREGRPYRTREQREKLKKEKEEREKREQEERRRRGESEGPKLQLKKFDATRAYYSTLGVDENASSKEIKRAYKKLALKYHPDKMNGKSEEEIKEAEQIFKEAMEAYEILVDEDTRERYDKARDARKYGKNSPMNNPDFAEKFAKMRERARKERERKMNLKADRIELIIDVSMEDLYSGCVKEIQYERKGRGGEVEVIKKNVEIRKGWSPKIPVILEGEGHRSSEFQDGDIFCTLKETEHFQFRRSGVKDLILRDSHCPEWENGDILSLVTVETLGGQTVNLVISYLALLLEGGGEKCVKIPLSGLPDPKAPWFDSPGDVLVKTHVPLSNAYQFYASSYRNVYMIGDENNCLHAAATAAKVREDYSDVFSAGKSKDEKKIGVCVCLTNHLSKGAQTFVALTHFGVGALEWHTIYLESEVINEQFEPPMLLDEEAIAIDIADMIIIDPGIEAFDFDISHLIAPIDADNVNACECASSTVAMVYGSGSCGQLGLGGSTQCPTFRQMLKSEDLSDDEYSAPTSVSAGDSHSAILLSNGEVLACGSGAYGQTGRPETKNTYTLKPIQWDLWDIKPKIISLSCGGRHTLLLDERGCVWSLGCGTFGQLGHGDTHNVNEPQKVWPIENFKETSDVRATAISAGGSHSLMCDSSGQAWSWGSNSNGQLGFEDSKESLFPTTLDLVRNHKGSLEGDLGQDLKICFVAAGRTNSAFITVKGEVYTCGSATSHLLGYAATADVAIPRKVEDLPNSIAKVDLQEHLAVACDKLGRVYTWGKWNKEQSFRRSPQLKYTVVHSKVIVRTSPSVSSGLAGVKYRGDTIFAKREQNGWIELAQESHPKGKFANGKSFWMLIDGSNLNLGILLKKIPDAQTKRYLPRCVPFDKYAKDVACHGSEIVVTCEDGHAWIVSHDNGHQAKMISSSTGTVLKAKVISASHSHVMIVCDQSSSRDEDKKAESTDSALFRLGDTIETDEDLELKLERASSLLQHHDLYQLLWNAYLRGSIVIGLGEACSLLGINKENFGNTNLPLLALVPNVIRNSSLERLHNALKRISTQVHRKHVDDDLLGGMIEKNCCYSWKQSLSTFTTTCKMESESSANHYLSNLCLCDDDIGGEELSGSWSRTMSLKATTMAVAGARDRLR